MMKILADRSIPFIETCLGPLGELSLMEGHEIVPGELGDAEVLAVRTVTRVDARLLEGSKVKFVATATSGHDHIDTDYLAKTGIGFGYAPGCNARSVAEYVLSSLCVLADQQGLDLRDKTVGIIGCGHVGSTLKSMLGVMGMKVLVNDPPRQRLGHGGEYVSLEQIQEADIISLHVPLAHHGDDPSFHLVDELFLSGLRSDVILLNSARGGVVDEKALSGFIDANPACQVVLDVWENEPDINMDLLPRVAIATPHIAGYSLDGKLKGTLTIQRALGEYLNEAPVTPESPALPEGEYNHINLSEYDTDMEAIQLAVLASYDVRTDSSVMSQIVSAHLEDRPGVFRELRNNYPVRREFSSMTVTPDDLSGDLANRLGQLGFRVQHTNRLV